VIARVASVVTAAIGIAVGGYVLFGATVERCSFATIGQTGIGQPVQTLEPARCETLSLVQSQPVWPMPFLAITVWSLVPLLAVVGAWRGRSSFVLVALLVECTAIASFAVGGYYVLYVAVPLLVVWVLTRLPARAHRAPSA
jgi:hypothetical protein